MANQESRLAIVIDSKDAEKNIKKLREALKDIGKESVDAGSGFELLIDAVKKLEPLGSILEAAARASGNLSGRLDNASRSVHNLRQDTEQLNRAQRESDEAMRRLSRETEQSAEELQRLQREVERARRELGDLERDADRTSRRISSLDRAVEGFNNSMSGLRNAALIGGGAIIGAGAMILKTSGNFEAAMNSVKAVSGAVGADFDALREKAKQLGSETAFSATEAANGMEFLAMAGMNTEQVLSTIPNALSLAAAGSLELADAADIMSNIMTGMGIAAEDSGRAADVLAKAAASANVDIKMVGESMKYVAPIAKQLGLTLEETAGMVGVLGNAGIQGSEAGTALRAVYSRLATDNKAKAHFHALGIEMRDAQGNMRPLIGLLQELYSATKDMSDADKLEVFKDVAGTEAMSALGVTMDSIADGSLVNLIDKLNNAEGAAKKMADTKMEGFEGAMKSLQSATEGLMIAMGDSGLLSTFSDLTNRFADWIRELSKADPELFKMVGTAAAVALGFSGLILAISGVGLVISGVISAFTGFAAIFGVVKVALLALGGPIGLTVMAITGLVMAGALLYQNWDTIKAKASEVWGSIKEAVSSKIDSLKASMSSSWESIKSITMSKAQAAVNAAKNAFNGLPAPIKSLMNVAYSAVKVQLDLIRNAFSTVMNVIKALIRGDMQGVVNAFKTGMSNAFSIMKTGASNILNAIRDLGSKLFKLGTDAVAGLIRGLKAKIADVKNAASELGQAAWGGVKSFLQIRSPSRKMAELGKHTADGLAKGIKKNKKPVISEAQKMAQEAIKAVKDTIATLQRDIALFGNDDPVAAMLWDRVNTDKYKGVDNGLFNQAVDLTKQKKALEDAKTLADKFKESLKGIQEAIKGSATTELEKWATALYDSNNELSKLESGKKLELLGEAANLDYSNLSKEMAKSSIEIDRQVELLGTKSDLDKELLKIGYEANDILEKYNYYLENGQIARYNEIKAMVMGNAEREKGLALAKAQQSAGDAFYNMTDSMQSESPMGKLIAERDKRLEILEQARTLEAISAQQHADTLLAIDQAYMDGKRDLMLTQSQDLFSGLSGLAKSFAGEQSGIYRALFAIEKGFAIAQSAIAIQQSVAKAMAVGFPANVPLIGQAIAQGGQIMSAIKSVAMPIGQAHDGIMSVPKSGTWNLEKGERVLPAHTAKAMDKKLDQGGKVIIHNHSGEKAEAKQDMDGNTIVTIGKMVNGMIDAKISNWENKARRQGGVLYGA